MNVIIQQALNALSKSKIGDKLVDAAYSVSRHLFYLRSIGAPIGVLAKSYPYLERHLYRNEGNPVYAFDGYGTPIGDVSNPMYNMFTTPWFKMNAEKNESANYIEYINNVHFSEGITPYNSVNEGNQYNFDSNHLNPSFRQVGAVRNYDYSSAREIGLGANGYVNADGTQNDSRLGIINNYFLSRTLEASDKYGFSNSGNYVDPSYADISKVNKAASNSITQGAYRNFGIGDGTYGMQFGESHRIEGRVATQAELLGEIIPWSTTDLHYNSLELTGDKNNNIDFVKGVLGTDSELINIRFKDLAQGVNNNTIYGGFGNYYSITYSLGLLQSSGSKTQNFIAKSMLGYDLLDDRYNDVNLSEYASGETNYKNAIKKYYATQGSRGSNYIDDMSGCDVKYEFNTITVNGEPTDAPIRVQIIDAGNDNMFSARYLYEYAEAEGSTINKSVPNATYNEGVNYGRFSSYNKNVTEGKKDLIDYTNDRFNLGKFGTLISRFHTDKYQSAEDARANRDMLSTAISEYGMSMGRNLLRRDHKSGRYTNTYSNPYCRVWTYHHQYSKISDLIRPFVPQGEFVNSATMIALRGPGGTGLLSERGAKTDIGLVRFAPTTQDNIKRCMFSIENLAWKHAEHRNTGPNGGRIMWFPPYDLSFAENVSVNWQPTQFIGRGESIYTYTNTERGGTLDFTLLIDHPSVVNAYAGNVKGGKGVGDVDDTESNEQTLLRFFAGCEILDGSIKGGDKVKTKAKERKVKDVELQKATYEYVCFYVFYPNNYSGVDDKNIEISPMWYLLNGITSQKTKDGNNREVNLPLPKKGNYKDDSNNVIGGYETRENGITYKDGVQDVTIAPMHRRSKVGDYRDWYYRVDEWLSNEVLHVPANSTDKFANYSDSASFQLNSIGYNKLTTYHTDANAYKEKSNLYSLADVYCALDPNAEEYLDGCINSDRITVLRALFDEFDVASVDICGYASSHGYSKNNERLAKNRADSIRRWLKENKKFESAKFNVTASFTAPTLKHQDVNKIDAKAWRCARCIIKLQKEDIAVGIDNINHYDNETQRIIDKARDYVRDNNIMSTADLGGMTDLQKKSTLNQVEQNQRNSLAEAEGTSKQGKFNPSQEQYQDETEYRYFKDLEVNSPFLHSKIVEKLQYFDPAYHSITPEGFNARLTFLQQCTRQGPTAAASDVNGTLQAPANNLSFGAPPVCVLRIGDFYNTRIIIESLNITYDNDGIKWDLNDEGVGVAPMFAKVSITFKFLGGSDLSGPIRELQNAVSFNYYANTRLYDSEAHSINGDETDADLQQVHNVEDETSPNEISVQDAYNLAKK